MTNEEHETLVNFDYPARRVIVYTTRKEVYGQILKRIGGRLDSCVCKEAENAFEVSMPMDMCRKPHMLISTERSPEQIERDRERGRRLAQRQQQKGIEELEAALG